MYRSDTKATPRCPQATAGSGPLILVVGQTTVYVRDFGVMPFTPRMVVHLLQRFMPRLRLIVRLNLNLCAARLLKVHLESLHVSFWFSTFYAVRFTAPSEYGEGAREVKVDRQKSAAPSGSEGGEGSKYLDGDGRGSPYHYRFREANLSACERAAWGGTKRSEASPSADAYATRSAHPIRRGSRARGEPSYPRNFRICASVSFRFFPYLIRATLMTSLKPASSGWRFSGGRASTCS